MWYSRSGIPESADSFGGCAKHTLRAMGWKRVEYHEKGSTEGEPFCENLQRRRVRREDKIA